MYTHIWYKYRFQSNASVHALVLVSIPINIANTVTVATCIQFNCVLAVYIMLLELVNCMHMVNIIIIVHANVAIG